MNKEEFPLTPDDELKYHSMDVLDESLPDFSQELIEEDRKAAMSFLSKSRGAIINTVLDYKELMMIYTCAMKEIKTKFDVLNTEFNVRYQRNPINFISTRLKRTASISEKLARRNIPFSLENIEEHIHDVAGIRVICSYVDDIYTVADALVRQDDIVLLSRKDYIAEPKPNGYRSLHLIVSVPVFFADQRKNVKVEVQIRTIAMDFWASLEHQLKYKQQLVDAEDIVAQLKDCAETIADTDRKMLAIRKQIEEKGSLSEQEIMLERIKKLDISIG